MTDPRTEAVRKQIENQADSYMIQHEGKNWCEALSYALIDYIVELERRLEQEADDDK
jgi:hypothetical protein